MKCSALLLLMFAAGYVSGGVVESNQDKPASYFRLYNDKVKLLPLSDKGLSASAIKPRTAGFKLGRPAPQPVFYAQTDSKLEGSVKYKTVPVELAEDAGVDRNAFVRFGFPLPQSALFDLNHIKILSPSGGEVDAQFAATAFWKDKSVKWVLIQFNAPLKANCKAVYQVAFGNEVSRRAGATTLQMTWTNDSITVITGPLKAVIDKKKFNLLKEVWIDRNNNGKFDSSEQIGGFSGDGLLLIDEKIKSFSSAALPPNKISVEENGPEKIVLKIEGRYGSGVSAYMTYNVRLGFKRNSPEVEMSISHIDTWIKNEFSDITSLNLSFKPADKIEKFTIATAGKPDKYLSFAVKQENRVFQEDDQNLSIMPGSKKEKSKLTGLFEFYTAKWQIGAALKNCWQRWPKAFAVTPNEFTIELLPEQPGTDFGKNLPFYLQYPFCEGKYRMKWGMSFTENLRFDFSGKIPVAALAAESNNSVIAVLSPQWYASTKVFPGVSTNADKQFSVWDDNIARYFKKHMALKAEQREYGFMNYGDWFGERGRNWGNNEYDLQYGLFMNFIRTGNRDYFRLATLGAEHQADVDCVHAYPDQFYLGANHQHSIGHTGVWTQSVKRASWTHPYDTHTSAEGGHTWIKGMLTDWCLTGNPRVYESALKLGEHIAWAMAPDFKRLGSHERSAGWSLIAICALYDLTRDPVYLRAADKIASIAMKEQKFKQGGAWPHPLPAGHAIGYKNPTGNCCFLIGILLNGLKNYHEVSNNPDAARSIIAGAKWFSTAWDDSALGWPYSAAPDGKPYGSACASCLNLLIAPSVAYAANLSGNKQLYDISEKSLRSSIFMTSCSVGKDIGELTVFTPELMTELYQWQSLHPETEKNILTSNDFPFAQEKIKTGRFGLRGPEDKKFIAVLKSTSGTINLEKIKHGSMPSPITTGKITIRNHQGKIIKTDTFEAKNNFNGKYVISGKPGDEFTITIYDDANGSWDFQSPDMTSFAEISPKALVDISGIKKYFITIPKTAKNICVTMTGIHSGSYGYVVIRPDGTVAGSEMNANEQAGTDFSGMKNAAKGKQTIKVTPDSAGKVWSIIFWASRDIKLKIDGIPPYLSTTATTVPANFTTTGK